MMDQASVRNLERIQEQDEARGIPRGVSVALVVLGGACVVFAVTALGGRRSSDATPKVDPLGDLVSAHAKGAAAAPGVKATELSTQDVTFPGILSDDKSPTTALAAVRGKGAGDLAAAPTAPPPPADRLPVVPLPAQDVLQATPVVTRPRDDLTKAAADSAQITEAAAAAAPEGHRGGYQLQVSSFRTQQEANAFAAQLRARGHKAYVVQANVVGRGTWFRVRVGPFATQHAAAVYRASFEAKEHVVPFIVPPDSRNKK